MTRLVKISEMCGIDMDAAREQYKQYLVERKATYESPAESDYHDDNQSCSSEYLQAKVSDARARIKNTIKKQSAQLSPEVHRRVS